MQQNQASPFNLTTTSALTDLANVFRPRYGSGINEYMLFIAHFNRVPNLIEQVDIDCRRANKWFAEQYKSEIKEHYFIKKCMKSFKKLEYDDLFYFLYEDLIVDFDTNNSEVRLLFKNTDKHKVEEILVRLLKFRNRRTRKSLVSLLVKTTDGIQAKALEIKKPRLSIEDNYNPDFLSVHQTILKRLNKKDEKGIVLLHGKPGTGKTSYIRYLISTVKKNVIFLPPNMAAANTSPDFLSVLIKNQNSIFVIEDAENVIVNREQNANSPVSALLNIADGLLSDCLNIQIICSFNTHISKVDSALLRKGRLIAQYEFRELQVQKAQALSDKLGFKKHISAPRALTAIYNQNEDDYAEVGKRVQIGFKTVA